MKNNQHHNPCGNNLKKAYEKIEQDNKCRPLCCVGPVVPVS